MQGRCSPFGAVTFELKAPLDLIMTVSPGATSRSNLKSSTSRATLSDAKIHSVLPLTSLEPMHNGLIPFLSLIATTPHPVIIATTENEPTARWCNLSTAKNTESSSNPPSIPPRSATALCSSAAKRFKSASESESVLILL